MAVTVVPVMQACSKSGGRVSDSPQPLLAAPRAMVLARRALGPLRDTLKETVMNHSRLQQPLILQASFVEPYAELIRRQCLPPLAGD